jgi:hypothetical protein
MPPVKSILISEEEKFKVRLNRSYTERFRMLMKLIKINRKLKDAKIINIEP